MPTTLPTNPRRRAVATRFGKLAVRFEATALIAVSSEWL